MRFWAGTQFRNSRELLAIARILDEVDFGGMSTGDHLIYPKAIKSHYPYKEAALPDGRPFWAPETEWPDTWVTISALAAVTTNLYFSNAVYVLPARPILEVAHQVGTASVLSGGRVMLGAGIGWMREEFDLLGTDFDNRAKRIDEMIPALKALWKGGWVSWKGEYYDIPELMMEPHPDPTVPILYGGVSDPALRRAARLCDGWVGTGCTWDEAVDFVDRLNAYRREYGRENLPFEIILALRETPSPDLYKRAEDIGITGCMVSPFGRPDPAAVTKPGSVEHLRAPVEKFAEEILAKCR
jgi:probable F420-dependent oxidoreductase